MGYSGGDETALSLSVLFLKAKHDEAYIYYTYSQYVGTQWV